MWNLAESAFNNTMMTIIPPDDARRRPTRAHWRRWQKGVAVGQCFIRAGFYSSFFAGSQPRTMTLVKLKEMASLSCWPPGEAAVLGHLVTTTSLNA